jgi:hypothetical protein
MPFFVAGFFLVIKYEWREFAYYNSLLLYFRRTQQVGLQSQVMLLVDSILRTQAIPVSCADWHLLNQIGPAGFALYFTLGLGS